MHDLANGPHVLGGPRVEVAGLEAAEPGLVAGREPGQPAGGFIEVDLGEPGEVGIECDHPPMPLVGQGRPASQPALDLGQVVE
jgi:hypothetical protein